jgi:glutamate-5-semialdehyde dehydrogenase
MLLAKEHMKYQQYFEKAVSAGRTLYQLGDATVNAVLTDLAARIIAEAPAVIAANEQDLLKMDSNDPKYDRLKLTEERLKGIAAEVLNVAALASPLAEVITEKTLPNLLNLKKVRVPLGVVGVIYEARPNVTVDVFSLCLKTGNVAVLKGGSDAEYSNLSLIKIIHNVLKDHGVDINAAVLLPTEREATAALLDAVGFVDVLIPRGSQALINYVRENSKVPVIETGAGIVHTYFDKSGDKEKAAAIIYNAVTRWIACWCTAGGWTTFILLQQPWQKSR